MFLYSRDESGDRRRGEPNQGLEASTVRGESPSQAYRARMKKKSRLRQAQRPASTVASGSNNDRYCASFARSPYASQEESIQKSLRQGVEEEIPALQGGGGLFSPPATGLIGGGREKISRDRNRRKRGGVPSRPLLAERGRGGARKRAPLWGGDLVNVECISYIFWAWGRTFWTKRHGEAAKTVLGGHLLGKKAFLIYRNRVPGNGGKGVLSRGQPTGRAQEIFLKTSR